LTMFINCCCWLWWFLTWLSRWARNQRTRNGCRRRRWSWSWRCWQHWWRSRSNSHLSFSSTSLRFRVINRGPNFAQKQHDKKRKEGKKENVSQSVVYEQWTNYP
jgi:hypothetical protein